MRNFRLEVGLIVFNRSDVRPVIELGLNTKRVEVFDGALNFPALGIGECFVVVKVGAALGFDNEVVFARIAGLEVATLEDEAKVGFVKVADGSGDAITLGQLEEANDLVVSLGRLGEGAFDGTAVGNSVVNS